MPLDTRTSRPLTDIGLTLATLIPLLEAFIAQRLLPAFEVLVSEGLLPFNVYDRRVYTADRAEDGTLRRVMTEVGNDKYSCKEGGLEAPLFDGEIRVYGTRERAEMHKAKQLLLSLLTAREATVAALLFNTTTFADAAHKIAVAGGKEWDAAADAGLPVTDLNNALGILEDRGFVRAKVSLILPTKTQRVLSVNKQFLDKTKATPVFAALGAAAVPLVLPPAMIAAALGVKEVIIAGGIKDTANRGKASSFSPVWNPDQCMVAYLGEGTEDDAGLGHTFVSSEGMDRSALSSASDLPSDPALIVNVDAYREEKMTADIIRVRDNLDLKVTNVNAAVLIDGCLA